jgi:hypothetical protein
VTAVQILPKVYDQPIDFSNATWFLSETLSYLRHLEVQGKVRSVQDGGAERWSAA